MPVCVDLCMCAYVHMCTCLHVCMLICMRDCERAETPDFLSSLYLPRQLKDQKSRPKASEKVSSSHAYANMGQSTCTALETDTELRRWN